jgi:hypothetical protein
MSDHAVELLRQIFTENRDRVNTGLGVTPDQLATLTIFQNARDAESPISCAFDEQGQKWVFQIGDNKVEITDPDVAAAAIGVASKE